MSLFDLTGKVAIVTGSSRGIGRSIAENLAAHGAKVVVSSRKADACEVVVEAIRKAGGTATAIPANISDKAGLQRLVDQAPRAQHVAGIAHPQLGPALDEGNLADDAAKPVVAHLASDAGDLEHVAQVHDLDDGLCSVNLAHGGPVAVSIAQ